MKHNVKPQSLFYLKSTLAVVLTALACVIGQHAQASSLSLDQNFNSPFFAVPVLGSRAVLLPNGQYVMFFNIDTLTDQSTGGIIRFNSDGTLDTTFSFSHDIYGSVSAVAPLANGQLIVAAGKTVYGVPDSPQHVKTDILRLNADGSIDSNFGPAQATDGGEVRVITANADGTIFVGGHFTAFHGQPNYGVVRLLSNGALDPAFAPVTMTCPANPFGGTGNCGLWAEPVIDANSKIVIAGDFVQINGVNLRCVARLNSDGTLDTSFTNHSDFVPAGFFAGRPRPIRGIQIQSDSKIVIGGSFNGGS